MIASSAGRLEIAELLILNKCEVNEDNNTGLTALHYAVSKNRVGITKLLIANNADINARDQYGNTPLHRAVSIEKGVMIQLLIDAGVDLDMQVCGIVGYEYMQTILYIQ